MDNIHLEQLNLIIDCLIRSVNAKRDVADVRRMGGIPVTTEDYWDESVAQWRRNIVAFIDSFAPVTPLGDEAPSLASPLGDLRAPSDESPSRP